MFAHEISVSSIAQAQQLSRTRYFWVVNYLCDYSSWDWLWEPVPWESHQCHAWASQHQRDSGTYLIPKDGYTDINYHTDKQIKRLTCSENWHVPNWIDPESIDYTWHANPLDPPYIYHFETTQQWNRIGGPEYRVPGATEVKYIDDIVATTKSNRDLWHIPAWIDPESIDYTWVPNPAEPPYIYEFAVEWGWDHVGGPEYRVPGAIERKYLDTFVAKTLPDATNFEIFDNISGSDDILRWRPNPTEQPYIYVFGNQWYAPEQRASARYCVPGATELKFVEYPKATRLPETSNFKTLHTCEFDFSWEPDPGDPPYIYVFGNQHWPANIMPTVEYHVAGATERKFMEYPVAKLPITGENWKTLIDIEFDFDYSWCPDPGDPPYIYVFGNQWHSSEVMPTVEYRVPGAEEIKYIEFPLATLKPNQQYWTIPEEVSVDNIDFSWCPDPGSPPYIYHFGSEYQQSVGLTYTVPGATEIKFAGDIPTVEKEKSAIVTLDIFYLDYSNNLSASRFEKLKETYPDIQRIRYVNSTMSTIQRCAAKAKTTRFWVISSRNDYSDFDFNWHPEPWQRFMTHVFGSQWNKWSDTFLINKWEFERHAKWATGIEQFPNLNFVKDQQVIAPADSSDIYLIDHGNHEADLAFEYLDKNYRVVKRARYFDNYLDTLRRIVESAESEYIWIVSSICDYSRFDFSWQPEAWQRSMLHVFPSNEQKFGDTFYVPVNEFKNQVNRLELLDWFDTVNYCTDQTVPRWAIPQIKHTHDSQIDAVLELSWTGPLAVFTIQDSLPTLPTVSLWREKTKTIVPLTPGAGSVIVPRTAVSYLKTQMYDYPYIDKTQNNLAADQALDIVFISNGEVNAEQNWTRLLSVLEKGSYKNTVSRSDGVNGRVAAYRAAAEKSNTPWFFAVFAKLEVDEKFDWNWQPDRLQQSKHYIFHAHNPVTGLNYGHMAAIAYNKKLVLENTAQGLDFTLDQTHEVVPALSGVARYYDSAWMSWRTAFRECIKLQHSLPDVENEYRLQCWLENNLIDDELGEWSRRGAADAVEYYNSVNGDFEKLRLTYDWEWLAKYAHAKHNLSAV